MVATVVSDELIDDFKQMEGLESGTLILRRTDYEKSVPITNALRLELDSPLLPLGSQGQESNNVTFVVLAEEADPDGNKPPQQGDVFKDAADKEYSVRNVLRVAFNTRYELRCSEGRD